VSVITVWDTKTALIFFNSILLDGKVNIDGTLARQKFKIPNSFQKHREYNINIKVNGIFKQNQFSTKLILVFGVSLKQLTV